MITTQYKTSDGKVFDTMCEASKHQEDRSTQQIIYSIEKFVDNLDLGYSIQREILIQQLFANRDLIKDLANNI